MVSGQHPACRRHKLLKQPALVLPLETRQNDPQEVQEMLPAWPDRLGSASVACSCGASVNFGRPPS
jgi:hypothetical protein